jgi:cell division protein FtsW
MKFKALHWPLFALQLALLALGLLCVATVNADGLVKQLVMVGGAVVVTLFVSQVRTKVSVRLGWFAWTVCALLLGVVLVVGSGKPGVDRWINLPGGYQLQPSEFTKIALIAYLASFFARKGAGYKLWGPIMVIAFSTGLILIAPSTSAAVFVFMLAMGVIFLSGVNLGRIIAIAVAAALVAYPAWIWQSSRYGYVTDRLTNFAAQRNGTVDENAAGYQVRVAKTVIERGGLWGRGPDEKKLVVPAQSTDFIISTLGHTTGLLGITVVFSIFAGILYIGLSIAARVSSTTELEPSERHGASILASGATLMIVGQAVINFGVVIGKLPNTGMALPMMSEGGSSLIVCAVALGWMHAANAMVTRAEVQREEVFPKAPGLAVAGD